MAWVALDRGIRLASEFGMRGDVERWAVERDAVRAAILERGVDPSTGAFRRAFDGDDVDAALLLIGSTGFLPPADPRIVRTIDVVRGRLGRGDLLRRYVGDDGLEGDEGAFLACSFWLARALADAGRRAEAEEVFDAACARSNDVGLLPEEIDATSGAFLGNVPQALSHIALLHAAAAMSRG
jgi:GH15 family glucan-1,4-alpha-glucosidase